MIERDASGACRRAHILVLNSVKTEILADYSRRLPIRFIRRTFPPCRTLFVTVFRAKRRGGWMDSIHWIPAVPGFRARSPNDDDYSPIDDVLTSRRCDDASLVVTQKTNGFSFNCRPAAVEEVHRSHVLYYIDREKTRGPRHRPWREDGGWADYYRSRRHCAR